MAKKWPVISAGPFLVPHHRGHQQSVQLPNIPCPAIRQRGRDRASEQLGLNKRMQ